MIGRRNVLKLIAGAPLGAKVAAENAAAALSGIATTGVAGGGLPPSGFAYSGESQCNTTLRPIDYAKAFRSKVFRDQIEEILYRSELRHVGYIDHDIASKRSFSLAAKITFQRQRNVQRQIEQMQSEYPWSRVNKMVTDALGWLMPKVG